MTLQPQSPWHKASYDQWIGERLPQLLAERLPLAGYRVTDDTNHTCTIHVELTNGANAVLASAAYTGIPRPDETGTFYISGEPRVVVPTASSEALDVADIACVGEQLDAHIRNAVGQASNGLSWDNELLRAWLPLDRWVNEFFQATAQRLDTTNWISRYTHLRRLFVLDRKEVVAIGQIGRVCPFETPEGPNIGRVFTIALGVEIRAGKLAIVDASPLSGLGISSATLPFIEHNDANRLLMAANLQRQGLPAPEPEPALVQTGLEPAITDAPDFWGGRNFLTAFLSLGEITTEDGIVISASAARRLNYPSPAEAGDKMNNRHGLMGVISQILPDDEMPHLPDGTPVELVYSFTGVPTRITYGPVLEAAWGRVAHAEGKPVIIQPYAAPKEAELRDRLKRAGLPESGQEQLHAGKHGQPFPYPTTIGWVYWNRNVHLVHEKLFTSAGGHPMFQGDNEAHVLYDVGAYENLREMINTRSLRRTDAAGLSQRLAAGTVEQAGYPTPMFADLIGRLQAAGIAVSTENGRLSFHLEQPTGDVLTLAQPLPHPWLGEQTLTAVGARPDVAAYAPLVDANQRLAKLLASQSPRQLVSVAQANLEKCLKAFLETLLQPEHLRFGEHVAFSARSVIAPGRGLHSDQVGLPEEIAWALFEPFVLRATGDAEAVRARDTRAVQALDEIMARSWVLVNHAPSLTPTTILAFHPVRQPGRAIRLHPWTCPLLNSDYDGDQVVVLLPITEAAQNEAGEKLSVAGHLRRDPSLARLLLPHADALWGLAWLSLTAEGRAQIAAALGQEPANIPSLLSQAMVADLLEEAFKQYEVGTFIERAERLTTLGHQAVGSSGASLSPLLGSVRLPALPEGDDPAEWQAYAETVAEKLFAGSDYADPLLGPQLLAAKTRLRNRRSLPLLLAPRGLVQDAAGEWSVVRHSIVEGLAPNEVVSLMAGARRGFAAVLLQTGLGGPDHGATYTWPSPKSPQPARSEGYAWSVLARARRAKHPGIVFARAAANEETDPLEDAESRLMCGM